MTRLKATEDFKQKVLQSQQPSDDKRRATKIDNAMETLRREMASLMDQDLSLMKQLLTLNETIEEIKYRRLHASSNDSMVTSSCKIYDSDCSINEIDAPISKSNVSCTRLNIPTIEITEDSNVNNLTVVPQNTDNYQFIEKEMIINGQTRRIIHGRGNFSMDSGYDEADDYQTDVELTL